MSASDLSVLFQFVTENTWLEKMNADIHCLFCVVRFCCKAMNNDLGVKCQLLAGKCKPHLDLAWITNVRFVSVRVLLKISGISMCT